MNKCPYEWRLTYYIQNRDRTKTHTHQEIIRKKMDQGSQKKKLGKIISKEAFVIQHETGYYHCWTDRDIG
jgi:hypothetical protein